MKPLMMALIALALIVIAYYALQSYQTTVMDSNATAAAAAALAAPAPSG